MESKTLEGTSKLVSHGWKHKAEKSVGSRFESPQLKSSSINILIPTLSAGCKTAQELKIVSSSVLNTG